MLYHTLIKKIHFPNTSELLKSRKLLKPEINTELNGSGVSVNYNKLIEMTTSSIINCVKMDNLVTIDVTKPLKAIYKDGCDGAGSQSVWNSRSMINASDHIFQYSVVPLRLEQGLKVLWKNPTPNAANCTRPIYLLRSSEDDPTVINLVISTTDMARKDLATLKNITDKDGITYKVEHEIHDTMKDLKLKKEMVVLRGCRLHYLRS